MNRCIPQPTSGSSLLFCVYYIKLHATLIPFVSCRRTYRVSESDSRGPGGEPHLWRLNERFTFQVLWAQYINATDNVCVKAGVYHGDEALCGVLQTTVVS